MKAVICSLNAKYVHSSLAPWCLLAAVRRDCREAVDLSVVEGTVNQPPEEILAAVAAESPDVVGFCCYIWNISVVKKLVFLLAGALPGVVIVLGGPEVSFCPEETLKALPPVGYILRGEGEGSFPRFLDFLASGKPAQAVPGLCFRLGGGIVCSPEASPEAEPPSPYCPEYVSRLKGRIAYLETSRGCPFSCAFCLSGHTPGVRFYNLERAKREMLLLANSGAETVKLVDRTFNCNPDRAFALFEFLIRSAGDAIPAGVCFHFEVGADLFDEKTLRLLASAPPGLIRIEAGIQSFSEAALAAVNRKTDAEKLYGNLRSLIAPRNIHVHVDLIAGLPYEGFESFGRTFDRAFSLRPDMLQVGFLKLLHGSRLRSEAPRLGLAWSPDPPYEILSGPCLSSGELTRLHMLEDAVERLYNSGRFRDTLEYFLKVSQMRPFELFLALGEAAGDTTGISLDKYTEKILKIGSALTGADPLLLRDHLVCDRLASGRDGRLPVCLQVPDLRLKHLRGEYFRQHPEERGRAGLAILYGGGEKLAAADYRAADPITGRYPLRIVKPL
ncbi:B12-binding domain-containing radical SAM protein [Papillibacter cinnamivorans]|uniref:Radical SAM superfamily enzyme YgiQ, UPF0313 family n=1 Tax=Papillibacter cinnamivorans DSM 12816 TaxID=1122930 RepID=A0A1W2BU41_9FIRM|nr:B12-binding domain-containing radical SAM protein [Papillibacter cinnamivorans]SMC76409.1 Radical SAM superfamily enzyme YgiQ, UPF0313 family [Papillibacter cinnamivorans DSM 12816]